MIALWMLYGVCTTGLIGLAARLAEEAVRAGGRATRWVWTTSLIASVSLPLLTLASGGRLTGRPGWLGTTDEVIGMELVGSAFVGLVTQPAPLMSLWREALAAVNGWLLVGWVLLSCLAALAYALTWRRLRVARQACRVVVVDGESVLLSRTWGPAAIGMRRPVVVVPEWLLRESADVRQLVLLHEREHVRAGDHAVLALSPLVAILMPWNIVLWWQLRRLRLAIEVDCDRRVLARGVEADRYGSLLINVAGRAREGALVPAMAASPSTLERRILAMTVGSPRHRVLHATACILAGVALVVLACDAPSPLDLGAASARATSSPALDALARLQDAAIELDGRAATVEEISALPPESIHHVEVMKRIETGATVVSRGIVRVMTHEYARVNGLTPESEGLLPPSARQPLELPADAIYEIDGRRADRSAALALAPDRIERVEVMKRSVAGIGAAASMSVVRITTR